MAPTQESKNAEEITKLRDYFLQRLDKLQELVSEGVTHEELTRELDRVQQEIVSNRTDLSGQVAAVKEDIKEVLAEMKHMQQDINNKQKESRNRIIVIQGIILTAFLSPIVAILIQLIFHRP